MEDDVAGGVVVSDLRVFGTQGINGGFDRGVGFQQGMDAFVVGVVFASLGEARFEKQEPSLALGRKPKAMDLARTDEAEAAGTEVVLYEIDLFGGVAGLELEDLEEGEAAWFVKVIFINSMEEA